MTRLSFLFLLVAAFAGCAPTGRIAAPATGPAAVVPAGTAVQAFAERDRVRIDLHLPGDGAAAGPLAARITSEADGSTLWSGTLDAANAVETPSVRNSWMVARLAPDLWEPTAPRLYRLTVGSGAGETSVRFGFRSFEVDGGLFRLNGRPYFLRGLAINPPGRTIPDSVGYDRQFVRQYIAFLQSQNINIIRIDETAQMWIDVCDEMGMMLFVGTYGSPRGATPRSASTLSREALAAWYRTDVLGPLASHPSVVIYILANEQASRDIPYLDTNADVIAASLKVAHEDLQAWDTTRPYIGNAGYGLGRSGDILDIHRYWGWYYNSVLSFYTLRDSTTYRRVDHVQPLTLSENTGNYTGVDGRFNLVSDTKQPDSQLNWTGHAPDDEQAARALAYQAFTAKNAIEITRRTRAINPTLSGLMPFTIPFFNWHEISGFEDMGPKPVFAQFQTSFQPVLLSWELWTPQVYAGTTVRPTAHVVNDAEDGQALTDARLDWQLVDTAGRPVASGGRDMGTVPYYAAQSARLDVAVPVGLPTGDYMLRGTLTSGGQTVSANETPLFVAAPTFAGRAGTLGRTVRLYDPAGTTAAAMTRLGVATTRATNATGLDASRDLFVVGADAWDATLAGQIPALKAFVAAGGRVVVLEQSGAFDASWLPAGVEMLTEGLDHSEVFPEGRPFRNAMAVNPERPGHPVFDGISRDRLFLWSDPTSWTPADAGYPQVYPATQGFALRGSMEHAAVLADYGHGLEGVALAELFDGGGSVLLSGLGTVARVGLDPAADRFLVNAVRYGASAEAHHAQPLVDRVIVWGDYGSEAGLVTGITSGLLVHTVPIVPEGLAASNPLRTDANGYAFAGGSGGWNSRPAIQYVARGRRPFGPYGFTSGGQQQLPRDAGPEGMGTFYARIPAGRTQMTTTVSNPADVALTLSVSLNGRALTASIPAGATAPVMMPTGGATTVGVTFRGDRRLVLLETRFDS